MDVRELLMGRSLNATCRMHECRGTQDVWERLAGHRARAPAKRETRLAEHRRGPKIGFRVEAFLHIPMRRSERRQIRGGAIVELGERERLFDLPRRAAAVTSPASE